MKAIVRGIKVTLSYLIFPISLQVNNIVFILNNFLLLGAQCCMELKKFKEAMRWCDDGLMVCSPLLVFLVNVFFQNQ